MSTQDTQIERFDAILDSYMSANLSSPGQAHWRTFCHKSAKIAAFALTELFPAVPIKAHLVELIARMADGKSFVHIGWKEDHDARPGSYPMHWAVQLGPHLYDPTFAQLKNARTPLRLPPTPYCFLPEWFSQVGRPGAEDEEGFIWVSDGKTPALYVGYKLRSNTLPNLSPDALMPDSEAQAHGQRVAQIYRTAPAQ